MVYRFKNMSVALWQYLNQPLFCRDVQQSVWKPSRFLVSLQNQVFGSLSK